MSSKYFFSLDSIKPQFSSDGGKVRMVTSKEVPGLVDIGFVQLHLKQRGSTEPVWHPNANKLGYCTSGNLLVTIRSPEKASVFPIKEGEMFFVPKGFIHHIENIGNKDGIINFAFDNALPETMHLGQALYSISDSVFNTTFGTQPEFVKTLRKSQKDGFIKVLPTVSQAPKEAKSDYKFDIQDSNKAVLTKGGFVQLGTKTNLSALQGLGILGFGLNPKGAVEPHWHTNAGELVYIVKGQTKITVLHPDGSVDVMNVNGGEGAFAPAGHFHNIENVGSDDVEVIAFFSDADPNYIGIGEVVGSFSNELLTSVFNTPPNFWSSFKKTQDPLVIVPV